MIEKLKTTISLLGVILLSLIASFINNPVYADSNIKVAVDGELIQFAQAQPLIVDSRTLIPVRAVSNALGAEVAWNGETRTVSISKADKQFTLTIDSKVVNFKNTDDKVLDVPAQIINDWTYVPVRFVSESFGYNVGWDSSTQTVSIATEGVNVVVSGAKEVKTTGVAIKEDSNAMLVIAEPTYFDHYEMQEVNGVKYVTDHVMTGQLRANYSIYSPKQDYYLIQITDISNPVLAVLKEDIKSYLPNEYELIASEVTKAYNGLKIYEMGEPGSNFEGVFNGWNVTVKKWRSSINVDIYR